MVFFDVNHAAKFIGVSNATIKNWVKTGVLGTHPQDSGKISVYEIHHLKKKIDNGDINRLKKRANKSTSKKNISPNEYISEQMLGIMQQILDLFNEVQISLNDFMFMATLSYLVFYNEIELPDTGLNDQKELVFRRQGLKNVILKWEGANSLNIKYSVLGKLFRLFVGQDILKQHDFLGALYQVLQSEGNKSQKGSYYTPLNVVQEMILDQYEAGMRFLDPCCGTGQFLLSCAKQDGCSHKDLYGIEVDFIAANIASINMLLAFPDDDFEPNIYHRNTLTDIDLDSFIDEFIWMKNAFDLIATNPPWGAVLNKRDLSRLYPEVHSGESFSYFVVRCRDFLKDGAKLSLILPESIINVKVHQDIRKFILDNYQIESIRELGSIFTDVFTNVYRMDLSRIATEKIIRRERYAKLNRIFELTNHSFMSICNSKDNELIDKLFTKEYITLKDNADWALGIVTGNNEKYLSEELKTGYEPIYRGKDVMAMRLGTPTKYIQFKPQSFQQVAPEWKYRVPEKLVYRFISNSLVFAYDNQRVLTLNSANICIPQISGLDMRTIAALFNSKTYNYLFRVLFNTHKILKSNLEVLPIPVDFLNKGNEFESICNSMIMDTEKSNAIDKYLMEYFELTPSEKELIYNIWI